jgi:hypothetical protein
MTSFTFGFALNGESEPQKEAKCVNIDDDRPTRRPFSWIEPKEVALLWKERREQEITYQEIQLSNSRPLRCACDTFVEAGSQESEVGVPLPPLIRSGEYEGGASVWECSLDLVRYFDEADVLKDAETVCELGCGHALASCWILREALASGRSSITLSELILTDYDAHVLKDVTISNLVLNVDIDIEGLVPRIRLGAGDWLELSKLIDDLRFDVILASETLYTESAARDTALFLSRHLRKTAYLATKRYYFGVGGGVDAFREAVTALPAEGDTCGRKLEVETIRVYDNGVGNIRELLKVTCVPE